MKKIILVLLSAVTVAACKNNPKKASSTIEEATKATVITSIYPETVTTVFNAHGGIDTWNKMKTLSFTIDKPNGNEVITTHLKTRAELIDTPTYTLGFDGETLWVNEKDELPYEGNAKFYKGLMSYFYAMPFILGDTGIIYEATEPLLYEGKLYPGLLISYEAGVGSSPDDQYVVYYNAETFQMEWLAYTVTFGKDEKSKDFHFIRYNNWQTVNGLLLPKSIDWYTYKDNVPVEKRNTVVFTDTVLSIDSPADSLFIKPKTATKIN